MSKPKIVIADTDLNYINPLLQKFIEEYFEQIEIEIISGSEYYSQYFSVPQKADILIISEELFTPTINRHNIGRIFLMTEQHMENSINIPNVVQIYKYTSIKEIFSSIVGHSTTYLRISGVKKKEPQIILVYSLCGGVGTTTVALGISACLNNNYKKVLYMNAARLQTFQGMLSNVTPISTPDVYLKLTSAKDNDIYPEIKHIIRNEGFSYIPPFRAALMSLGIDYSIYENIAASAKKTGEYDYIIIDADTALDEYKSRLIDIADKVIIVTKQNKNSVSATNILVSNINGSNSEKFIYICNDFIEENENMIISHDIINKFSANDYIGHIANYEEIKASDLANEKDIQKVAFLII